MFIMFSDTQSYLVRTYDFYICVLVCVFLNTILLCAASGACEAHMRRHYWGCGCDCIVIMPDG